MPDPLTDPLPCCADAIIAARLRRDRRVLVIGPMGSGKSTLVAAIGRSLAAAGRRCIVLSADPGTPGLGPPGVLSLGLPPPAGEARQSVAARGDASLPRSIEPLCSLDAVRFRLPLVDAARRLAARVGTGALLVDAPGVTRGAAAAELIHALAEAVSADLVLVLGDGLPRSLEAVLTALRLELVRVEPHPDAHRPGPRTRSRSRTAAWDRWLVGATEQWLGFGAIAVTGAPPPMDRASEWVGRQVAVLDRHQAWALGEILEAASDGLRVRIRPPAADPTLILVRDARRDPNGLLGTAPPFAPEPAGYLPPVAHPGPSDGGPCPVARVGALDAVLVNGIFGDPLLHVRIRHLGRSLLFDLGEGVRLSARLAHQVSDCFVSHAHMDHLSGFIWLLRSRLGELPPCRIHGPPGLAARIHSLVGGFLWDRIGDCGPAFEIIELDGDRLERFFTRAGHDRLQHLGGGPAPDGVLLEGAGFRVRAITLDHGTPVLAYALEPEAEIHVRKDRLREHALSPGPWLSHLKSALRAGDLQAAITLPDGGTGTAGVLGAALTLTIPGKRLVYATDLADSQANRNRLIALAADAHTLFLEAGFTEADRAHAEANGHLTARACGEIAEAAGVARLVPFHLSRRYQSDPSTLLDELAAACPRVVLPQLPPSAT